MSLSEPATQQRDDIVARPRVKRVAVLSLYKPESEIAALVLGVGANMGSYCCGLGARGPSENRPDDRNAVLACRAFVPDAPPWNY